MNRRKAITLVELMIALGISALACISLYYVITEQMKQANLLEARNHIKQESNKIFKLLENDLSQAKKGTFSQKTNEFSIRVRTKEVENLLTSKSSNDALLKYTFKKPELRRAIIDGKNKREWLVSKSVESIEIEEPTPAQAKTSPGKLVVALTMKSNIIGVSAKNQPIYEQNKVIIMKEDATSVYDPNWLDVGSIGGVFQTDGNLLADLKEQFIALGQEFIGVWAGALGDISNMTIGELKEKISSLSLSELKDSLSNVKESLEKVKDSLVQTNNKISNLAWNALYKQMEIKKKKFLGITYGTNEEEVRKDSERKEKLAQGVKDLLASYDSKEKMNWDAVKNKAGSELTEDGETVLKGLFSAKESSFENITQLTTAEGLLSDQLSNLSSL